MTQQEIKSQELIKKFPFVNIVFGTHNLFKFKQYLLENKNSQKRVVQIWKDESKLPEEIDSYRTSGYNAWVNINYGCNNFCTYCIVPYVRGREVSRNFDGIVNECKALIEKGYKTITLLGQNVNSYGHDLNDPKYTFANLLQAIANLEGDFLIKFMSPHPKDFNEEVVKVIAQNKKISRLIHLPLQSGSTRILNYMNRKYTAEKFLSEVEMIRKYIPDSHISTDIIVGFPHETEQDFLETLNLVKKVKFNTVFAFMYSKRKGTVAEKMDEQVSTAVKHERVNILINAQREIEKDLIKDNVGKIQRVIMESCKNGKILAKNEFGQKVVITNATEDDFKIDFVTVKIIDFKKNVLIAEIV